MIYKKISLFPDREDVYLEAFVADPLPHYTRKALLVIPGGAYAGVCSDREGEPIALAFMPYGYNAFVLHYSVARKRAFPEQLIESSAAVKHIRDNAETLRHRSRTGLCYRLFGRRPYDGHAGHPVASQGGLRGS